LIGIHGRILPGGGGGRESKKTTESFAQSMMDKALVAHRLQSAKGNADAGNQAPCNWV